MTYEYRSTPLRVVDGDTVDVMIDLGFHVHIRQRVRLLNVDTPERGQPGWGEAKTFVERWMAGRPVLYLRSEKPHPRDKYARYLADIYDIDGQSLNEAIRTSGHTIKENP